MTSTYKSEGEGEQKKGSSLGRLHGDHSNVAISKTHI
jgi:hypothetical protein